MGRTVIAIAALLLLAGCAPHVCPEGEATDPEGACEPNGYCELDADCAAGDFCLVAWCYAGPDCEPVNRCTPRGDLGTICEADRWCKPGLRCDLPKDCGGTPCMGSVCVEVDCRTTDQTIAECEALGFADPSFAFDARCSRTIRHLNLGEFTCAEACLAALDCERLLPLTCCR